VARALLSFAAAAGEIPDSQWPVGDLPGTDLAGPGLAGEPESARAGAQAAGW